MLTCGKLLIIGIFASESGDKQRKTERWGGCRESENIT